MLLYPLATYIVLPLTSGDPLLRSEAGGEREGKGEGDVTWM